VAGEPAGADFALANQRLYERGSDDVGPVNAVCGERCNPHSRNFSGRMIRPGEHAFLDIMHSCNGYRTCYYRCPGSRPTRWPGSGPAAQEIGPSGIEILTRFPVQELHVTNPC
jgi:hypothetical protein